MAVKNNSAGTMRDRWELGKGSAFGLSRSGTQLSLFDEDVGLKTLRELAEGGISAESHRQLDQLTHELDESHYTEYGFTANRVTSIDVYTDATKTTKIRDYAYTYTGNKINTETIRQYNGSGSLVETLTYTYSYTGNYISSYTCVRS